ncbi:MAG TPA: F390 synthetase-related protein [Candidatus Bathyarchaeia archaeon]|nr:F390 synthetase-related protein [Candidatus Bathyarchaeia archaeon]
MILEADSFIRFFFGCKRRFHRYNEVKINQYQLLRGKEIVEYAYNNAPFFKKYYQKSNLDDIWNLPIITKQLMMENFSDYNTLGFTMEELLDFTTRIEREENYSERFRGYNVAMSSGTSGNKGIVITSPAEEKYLQAAFFARFSFPCILRIKWAFMLRITTPAFQVSKFGQRLTHINLLLTLDKIREKLQKFQPNILSAPPSMLKILAKEINESRLDIKPKRVVSYAEVLEPDIKQELEEVFRTPIHQIYQGSEGSIGLTCKKGSLHVNEDLVNLQLYNKDGSLTEPGTPCFQSIVTDLHKKSQPIIRFKLNDIITISPEKCQCGSSFRVIEQIMGRADDLFWGERIDTNELQYIFPDYIRRAIISSSEDIEEYQAIQKNFTRVLVRILTKKGANKEIIAKNIQDNIKTVFSKYSCKEPTIEIRFEPPMKNPNSNKLIRIQRDFKV